MTDRLSFFLNRLKERLWVKPLVMCVLSMTGVVVAKWVDALGADKLVPEVTKESVETLLAVISSSMLVMATFAVGSMISAYSSASRSATPRSFSLVVADDVSQNALSTFIGAFIFSIVALIALKNEYFGIAGRFALFVLTLLVFTAVILTFVRWMDRVARLGRLGMTIEKVEEAAASALEQRRRSPNLGGVPTERSEDGRAVYGDTIGYVQRIDVAALQACAEESQVRLAVAALPGAFVAPDSALAYVRSEDAEASGVDDDRIVEAFRISNDRTFDEDPRFGLVVLCEIASKALSPAVNDPGTAIGVIGSMVRLFALWAELEDDAGEDGDACNRVEVPSLSLRDMFDDAFTGIARDGAGTVEVVVRLQKALRSLAAIGGEEIREVARVHGRLALARAENALELPEDLEVVREAAAFIDSD